MKIKLIQMQKMLAKDEVLIIFSGRFSQGIIEELGEALKKHLESQETPTNEVFNVFSVFIEQTQNIKNYTISKEGKSNHDDIVNSGIVSIGKHKSGYYVSSGNLVENNDLLKLTEKLDKLALTNKGELKKLYKEQLRKEVLPGSLGAGLGLIDMARKASEPICYNVDKINETVSFFELTVIV